MITDRIGRKEVFLPINHKNYNFREKKNNNLLSHKYRHCSGEKFLHFKENPNLGVCTVFLW